MTLWKGANCCFPLPHYLHSVDAQISRACFWISCHIDMPSADVTAAILDTPLGNREFEEVNFTRRNDVFKNRSAFQHNWSDRTSHPLPCFAQNPAPAQIRREPQGKRKG